MQTLSVRQRPPDRVGVSYVRAYKHDLYGLAYIGGLFAEPYSVAMVDLARTPKQLGNAIRNARKTRGLSQTELGERTGLRQATISQIEAGRGGAKLENILKILAALGLELRIAPRSLSSGTRIEDIF